MDDGFLSDYGTKRKEVPVNRHLFSFGLYFSFSLFSKVVQT